MRSVFRGVQYMHAMGICHRDLKPENLLIKGDIIKITDFGLSKDFSMGTMKTSCGTASYAAPEVLMSRPYTSECDVWSAGVITFILLSAEFPFFGSSEVEIFKSILEIKYRFKEGVWDRVSENAKDFIRRIFVLSEERMSAEQALEHPWLSGDPDDTYGKKKIISFSKKLQDYVVSRKNFMEAERKNIDDQLKEEGLLGSSDESNDDDDSD